MQIGEMLRPYIAASTPLIAVSTYEDARAMDELAHAFLQKSEDKGKKKKETRMLCFDAQGKLREAKLGADGKSVTYGAYTVQGSQGGQVTSVMAIEEAWKHEDVLMVMNDQQHFIKNPGVYRALKSAMPNLKGKHSSIIMLAPHWKLPDELLHDVVVLEWDLPDRTQLMSIERSVEQFCSESATRNGQELSPLDEEARLKVVDAAAGMAAEQAENAMSIAACASKDGSIDPEYVLKLKKWMIKNAGDQIEIWEPIDPKQVGGVELLKEYVKNQILPFKDDPTLRIRGLLMAGIPGTGKSLSTKAIGAVLGWPIINASIPALKGSLVGQSEQNMRRLLRIASASAPVVLSFDELEKGVAGYQNSGQTDSGVSIGMLGELLTWMQENTAPVLVTATCNDPLKMPPELLRRFESRWYLDLPTADERRAIAEIHLIAIKCKYTNETLEEIVSHSDSFTGSEVKDLVYMLAREYNRAPKAEHVEVISTAIKPISQSQNESNGQIQRLREWAKNNLRPASAGKVEETPKGRKIRTNAGKGGNN